MIGWSQIWRKWFVSSVPHIEIVASTKTEPSLKELICHSHTIESSLVQMLKSFSQQGRKGHDLATVICLKTMSTHPQWLLAQGTAEDFSFQGAKGETICEGRQFCQSVIRKSTEDRLFTIGAVDDKNNCFSRISDNWLQKQMSLLQWWCTIQFLLKSRFFMLSVM